MYRIAKSWRGPKRPKCLAMVGRRRHRRELASNGRSGSRCLAQQCIGVKLASGGRSGMARVVTNVERLGLAGRVSFGSESSGMQYFGRNVPDSRALVGIDVSCHGRKGAAWCAAESQEPAGNGGSG